MAPSSLRDKTRAVRRAHVLQAALGVFAERGFRGATIRDVARAAGVSDGTIYNTFENKTAMLMALLEPLEAAPALPGGLPAFTGDLAACIGALIRQRWQSYTPETLAMLRVVLAEVLVSPELRTLFFVRVLKPALDGAEALFAAYDGDGHRDGNILSSRVVNGQLLGLLLLRLLDDQELEARKDDVPDRLADLFQNGLRGSRYIVAS